MLRSEIQFLPRESRGSEGVPEGFSDGVRRWLQADISLKPPLLGASLVAQMVKDLPGMQETWVQFLGQEDPLEKGMATHSSILA